MKTGLLWSGCCTYYASTIGHSKKPNPVYRISPTIAEDVPLENDLGFVLSGWTFLFPTDFETSSGCIRAFQLSSHNRPFGSWIDPINVKYFKMADMSIWSPSSQPSPLLTPTPQTFWIRHWCACTLTPNVCRVVICASDVKVLFCTFIKAPDYIDLHPQYYLTLFLSLIIKWLAVLSPYICKLQS